MTTSNKILYFLMGALFAVAIGWGLYRPVEAVAPSTVERKVDVLSTREVERIQREIASLQQSIRDDEDFMTTKYTAVTGKAGGSAQYAQRKHDIDQNLPGKKQRLESLRDWMKTLKL
jgi:hypothetical protein